MNKVEVRKLVLRRRESMSPGEVMCNSERVKTNLFALPIFQKSQVVMAYMSFRNEVATEQIVKQMLDQGKKVAIPSVNKEHRLMVPSLVTNIYSDLVPGCYGILEPKPSSVKPVKHSDIDVVLVPGVAFDPKGNRLGYGGGYYDRFLSRCRADAVFIALCYQFQVLDDLSQIIEEHDQRVHYLVTDSEVINIKVL